MSKRRVAIVARPVDQALHGLDGTFAWGVARTFGEDDFAELRAWAPDTVMSVGVLAPSGPWRTIGWDVPAARRVGGEGAWRNAPAPAADALAGLQTRPGAGVLVVGGGDTQRQSVLDELHARNVQARGAEQLDVEGLERAAVVALVGEPGAPLSRTALAVLAAGRLLIAPRAEPTFGLLPGSDHLSYEHEAELLWCADVATMFPQAFEPIAAMAAVAVEPHWASVVYGRIALDAELEDAQSSSAMRGAAR
jgi:hypothetical protein